MYVQINFYLLTLKNGRVHANVKRGEGKVNSTWLDKLNHCNKDKGGIESLVLMYQMT